MTFAYSDPLRSPQGPPPERQRSYKYYAAQASRSNSHSHGVSEGGSNGGAGNGQEGRAAGQEEEDDGGWTVDPPGGKAYTDRLARQRRNKNTSNFGIMHGTRSPPYPSSHAGSFGGNYNKPLHSGIASSAPLGPGTNHAESSPLPAVTLEGDETIAVKAETGTNDENAEGAEGDAAREDGGWTVDEAPKDVGTSNSPRQIRTVSTAPVLSWLGQTAPHRIPLRAHHEEAEAFQPHQPLRQQEDLDSTQGRQYTGPMPSSGPRYMLHASMHDPNRFAVANPKPWGNAPQLLPPQSDPNKGEDTHLPLGQPIDPSAVADKVQAPSPAPKPDLAVGKLTLKEAADANEALTFAASDDLSDGGWAKDSQLKKWAQGVQPGAVPEAAAAPGVTEATEAERPSSTAPSDFAGSFGRPSSAAAIARPPPVTTYVSDDESEPDLAVVTPGGHHDHQRRPDIGESEHRPLQSLPEESCNKGKTTTYAESDHTETRRGREYHSRRQKREDRGQVYWKRSPHPAFSAQFRNRRILIKLPFRVRADAIKTMLSDHMARYGSIRCIWLIDQSRDAAEQALVVYDEAESVDAFMADPDRNRCHSRSANRAGTTAFDIEATIPPDRFHCVTIFIKVTGERGDTRSRSASPTPSTAARAPNEKGSPRLPIGVHIDAVPWLNRRQGKIEYWARVRPDHIAFDALADRVLSETGQQARNLAYVEMGRRVAEKDFIPQLAEYFVDINGITPPTSPGQGWLIDVGGVKQAHGLMGYEEMGKIQGLTVRYATPEDGIDDDEYDARPESVGTEPSPMSRYEELSGGPIVRDDRHRRSRPADPHRQEGASCESGRKEDGSQQRQAEREDRIPDVSTGFNAAATDASEGAAPGNAALLPAIEHVKGTTASAAAISDIAPASLITITEHVDKQQDVSPKAPTPALPTPQAPPHDHANDNGIPAHANQIVEQESPFPYLQRRLEYTYRGRILRMDNSGPEPRFFDDAGVFVGRFCQDKEDMGTLLARFSRYGYICDIEYKPVSGPAYGSARILFGDSASAERALKFESGRTNYGAVMNIDRRRVLPSDVELKECLVDDFGRVYSPTMAPQYSPPGPSTRKTHQIDPADTTPLPQADHQPVVGVPGGSPGQTPFDHYRGPAAYGHQPQLVPIPMPMPPMGPAPVTLGYWGQPMPLENTSIPGTMPQTNFFPILYAMGVGYYPPPASHAPHAGPPVDPASPSPLSPRAGPHAPGHQYGQHEHPIHPMPHGWPQQHPQMQPLPAHYPQTCQPTSGPNGSAAFSPVAAHSLPPPMPTLPEDGSQSHSALGAQHPAASHIPTVPHLFYHDEQSTADLVGGRSVSDGIAGGHDRLNNQQGDSAEAEPHNTRFAEATDIEPELSDSVRSSRSVSAVSHDVSPMVSRSTRSGNGPEIKAIHTVNGVMKVIYDTDDLRRYCEETGTPFPVGKPASARSGGSRSDGDTEIPPPLETEGQSVVNIGHIGQERASTEPLESFKTENAQSQSAEPSEPGELRYSGQNRSTSIPIPFIDQVPLGAARWSTPPTGPGHDQPYFLSPANSIGGPVANSRRWGNGGDEAVLAQRYVSGQMRRCSVDQSSDAPGVSDRGYLNQRVETGDASGGMEGGQTAAAVISEGGWPVQTPSGVVQ